MDIFLCTDEPCATKELFSARFLYSFFTRFLLFPLKYIPLQFFLRGRSVPLPYINLHEKGRSQIALFQQDIFAKHNIPCLYVFHAILGRQLRSVRYLQIRTSGALCPDISWRYDPSNSDVSELSPQAAGDAVLDGRNFCNRLYRVLLQTTPIP